MKHNLMLKVTEFFGEVDVPNLPPFPVGGTLFFGFGSGHEAHSRMDLCKALR